MPRSAAQKLITAETRAKVAKMAAEGMTFEAIGKELGFSKQRANAIFWSACAAIESPAVEALRSQHLAETARAREIAQDVMERDHLAHSQGRVVMLENQETGEKTPLLDDGPKLDAARTLIAIQAREAKLVGADAPSKVEADVTGRVDPESIPLLSLIARAREAADAEEAALREGE